MHHCAVCALYKHLHFYLLVQFIILQTKATFSELNYCFLAFLFNRQVFHTTHTAHHRWDQTTPRWPLEAYLQCLEGVREGLHPDQEGGDDDGGGVVGAVVAPCSQVPWRAAARTELTDKHTNPLKSQEREQVPSPSVFSTSSYLSMNICLLRSVWAPIGLDRSRKVSGLDRSRVWPNGT